MRLKNTKYKVNGSKESGLGMVEIIVVIAIISTAFVGILQLAYMERRAQTVAREDIAAYMLARESLEATRSIRDDNWSNVSSLTYDTPYYPVINGSTWEFSSSDPGPINGYTRWIEISEVFRDANDDINSAGTTDADTKKVTALVEWTTAGDKTRSVTLETYLTNWRGYR